MLPSFIRKALKSPLTLALRFAPIRTRLAFELKYRYFESLELNIPLTHGFACPVKQLDALYSFNEIFISGEYGNFLERMPFPRRWLDLGCHAGYFSLYLAWQFAVRGGFGEYAGLLLDADPRAVRQSQQAMELNRLEDRLRVHWGALGAGGSKKNFYLRHGMGSSDSSQGDYGIETLVPVVTERELMQALPPPYDLIKLDVEGAEYDFLRFYPSVCQNAKFILLEWHAWDGEQGRQAELAKGLLDLGFRQIAVIRAARRHAIKGAFLDSGISLYQRDCEAMMLKTA